MCSIECTYMICWVYIARVERIVSHGPLGVKFFIYITMVHMKNWYMFKDLVSSVTLHLKKFGKHIHTFVFNICSVTVMLFGFIILHFLAILDKFFRASYTDSFQLPFDSQGTDAYLKGYLSQYELQVKYKHYGLSYSMSKMIMNLVRNTL